MLAHRFDGGMPDQKPYTHVRLILSNDGHINQRYEVRVSTFVQFDDDAGRRAVTGAPTKAEAEETAKEIARSERIRTGAPSSPPARSHFAPSAKSP
jgi:hypothetical protein